VIFDKIVDNIVGDFYDLRRAGLPGRPPHDFRERRNVGNVTV